MDWLIAFSQSNKRKKTQIGLFLNLLRLLMLVHPPQTQNQEIVCDHPGPVGKGVVIQGDEVRSHILSQTDSRSFHVAHSTEAKYI